MSLASSRALLVTVDPAVLAAVGQLGAQGPKVLTVATGADALRELAELPMDLALLDLDVADIAPRDLLATMAHRWSDLPVVLLCAPERVDDAVDLVRKGAEDFVRKPVHGRELGLALERAVLKLAARGDQPPQARQLASPSMLGQSAPMLEVQQLVERAARSRSTVLVRGETGSGKEMIARRIHELSDRGGHPFVKVHSAALPEQLLESELFGYDKGAFTGAASNKPGRVELAEGGTLFLDEIGDITPATQVKLLRILQDRKYERLGGSRTIEANVRFITATHRNLEQMVASGEFREDLYYRINVVSITAPPLRSRPDDIPELARHFARLASEQNGRDTPELAEEALRLLSSFNWPGNVRQLQNVMERLVVMTDASVLTGDDVRAETERIAALAQASGQAKPTGDMETSAVLFSDAVSRAERRVIEKALRRAGGNRSVAARILGVSRRTLYYKLVEYGIGK